MKVIIAGPRDFFDAEQLDLAILEAQVKGILITEVVCGKARGVDTLGEEWAKKHNIPVKYFPADWDGLGKAAGHVRNGQMARYGEALIALAYSEFPSPGTTNMIATALAMNLKVHVHKVERTGHETKA